MVTPEQIRGAIKYFMGQRRPENQKGFTKFGSQTHAGGARASEYTLTYGPCSYTGTGTCPALKILEARGKTTIACTWGADPQSFWPIGDFPYKTKPASSCDTRVQNDPGLLE